MIIVMLGIAILADVIAITMLIVQHRRQTRFESTVIAAFLADRVTLAALKNMTITNNAAIQAVLRRVTQVNTFCDEYSWRLAHFTDEELKAMADAEYERVYGEADSI